MSDHLWAVWLAVAVLLGVAEMFSLDLIVGMVAVGALAGMATALVGTPFVVQAVVAGAVSVGTLVFLRPPLVNRLHTGPELRLGHGKLVGHEAVVTQVISANDHGRVKLAGEIWTAAPYDPALVIEPGRQVEVLQIKGATAYVHPLPQLED